MVPSYEASMTKVYGSELGGQLYKAGMGMRGLFGQLKPVSPCVKLKGRIERGHQWNMAMIMAAIGIGVPRT